MSIATNRVTANSLAVLLVFLTLMFFPLISRGSMHCGGDTDVVVNLGLGIEGPHTISYDKLDKSSLVMFLRVESRLVINATNEMESNPTLALERTVFDRSFDGFWANDHWSRFSNALAGEQKMPVVTLRVYRVLHDSAKLLMRQDQIITQDNQFHPKADIVGDRMSEVFHRDIKCQHAPSSIKCKVGGDIDSCRNPRPFGQLKLLLNQISLPTSLFDLVLCEPDTFPHVLGLFVDEKQREAGYDYVNGIDDYRNPKGFGGGLVLIIVGFISLFWGCNRMCDTITDLPRWDWIGVLFLFGAFVCLVMGQGLVFMGRLLPWL